MRVSVRPQGSIVQRMAEWVVGLHADGPADAAFRPARLLLLDTIACAFAALHDEVATGVIKTVEALGGRPECTVIGRPLRTSAPNAVLANGVLLRVHDHNDYTLGAEGNIQGHPSDNIPVALAFAELRGATGRQLLTSIMIGYELYSWCRGLMPPESGWDGVSASGIAAPAMAGYLMHLDVASLAHAISLSGARAATPGIVRSGHLSAAKSMANALVAQNGAQAALLALNGATGPLDLFEGERGLQSMFQSSVPAGAAPWTTPGSIEQANIKVHPCVVTAQSLVAAGLEMHKRLDRAAQDIQRIVVTMADYPSVRRQQCDPGRINPRSREAADHSFTFLAAVTLLDGCFGQGQFSGDRWNDPAVLDLIAKTELRTAEDLKSPSGSGYPCRLEVFDPAGHREVVEILETPGFSGAQLDENALIRKSIALLSDAIGERKARKIIDFVLASELDVPWRDLYSLNQSRPLSAI